MGTMQLTTEYREPTPASRRSRVSCINRRAGPRGKVEATNHQIEPPRPMGIANELWAHSFECGPEFADEDAVADAGLALAGWDEDDGATILGISGFAALVAT